MVGVLVEGVTATSDGAPAVFTSPLLHGAHLDQLAWDEGYTLIRPLTAFRRPEDLVVRVLVEPRGEEERPVHRPAGPAPTATDAPHRQRVAAYAVVTSERGLLATQFSARTGASGQWGLPGGGLEANEEPRDAVCREVYEETGQRIELSGLEAVQVSHWIGPSPIGQVENFHAIRLVYRGVVPQPTDTQVLDLDGTTSAAQWVPLAEWPQIRWTTGARQLLHALLDDDALDDDAEARATVS
jgi:8-oxo-dGTP pyrophosphatase MutT (NUDIX family)